MKMDLLRCGGNKTFLPALHIKGLPNILVEADIVLNESCVICFVSKTTFEGSPQMGEERSVHGN